LIVAWQSFWLRLWQPGEFHLPVRGPTTSRRRP